MNNAVIKPGTGGYTPSGTQRTVIWLAGVAFLVFFIAWIPLYNWLAALWPGNELALALASAAFWLLVFGFVVAAVRWSGAVFQSWTTADLMLTAVLGAVFGLLFFAWAFVYNAFGFLGPYWSGLLNGLWFVPAILVPYIVRKPGAALVGETLAGVVAVLLGSPWGILGSAIAALTQGLGAEVVFALTGWRRYDWLTLALAGAAAAITGFVFVWPIWFVGLDTVALTISFVAILISVLVMAVVGGKLLGDALLSTGVLNRFAIGRERRAPQSDF